MPTVVGGWGPRQATLDISATASWPPGLGHAAAWSAAQPDVGFTYVIMVPESSNDIALTRMINAGIDAERAIA